MPDQVSGYIQISQTVMTADPGVTSLIWARSHTFLEICYPLTKWEGYSFGVVRPSTLVVSQYLLVRFDSFLLQMISSMDTQYPISLVKINPLTLELLPLFWYRQLKGNTYISFLCDDLHISSKLLYLTTSHYRPCLPSVCR